MRYVVTGAPTLIPSTNYSIISIEEALEKLYREFVWGLDTETRGFDPHTKSLFTVQIGNYYNQFLIDCETVDIRLFKEFFENPNREFILHNAKFDLRFFYHKRIILHKVYDTFLAEKLCWLGYPAGFHGLSLDACCQNYLGVALDKSVRGALHYEGLSERVIVYGCEDVKYLIPLREAQYEEIKKRELCTAIHIENEFVKSLAYVEYCGIKLDAEKWKIKMAKDLAKLEQAKKELNQWVLDYGDPRFITSPLQGDLFSGYAEPYCNINWKSTKQVIPLFEKLGFDLTVIDKDSGLPKKSIESDIIAAQAEKSTIVDSYLRYSEAAKVVSTYGQSFLDYINKNSGRIHTQYNQLMDTTRLSSGGKDKDTGMDVPNLQNLPADEETRSSFIVEEGNSMICADYSA